MATLDQIAQALQAADAAGDTQAATQLAQAYQQMKSQAPEQSTLGQVGGFIKDAAQSGGRMLMNAAVGIPGILADGVAGGANVVADAAGGQRPFPVLPSEDFRNRLAPVLGQRPAGAGGIAEDVGSAVIGSKLPLPGQVAAAPAQAATQLGTRAQQVKTLADEGVQLDSSQALGGKLPLTLKNAANDGAYGDAQAFRDTQNSQFTNAALRQMGVNAKEATPSVMLAGKKVLQKNYNDIAARNSVDYDTPLHNQLATIQHNASQELTPEHNSIIEKQLASITDKVAKGNGSINGPAYQDITESLGRIADQPGVGHYASSIEDALNAALTRSASPGDAALLAQTNQRYGAMKAIQKAIVDNNQVSPSLLYNAMDTAKGANQSVFGQGANGRLMDLAQAGKSVLGNNTANSGTPQRLAGLTAVAAPVGAGIAALSGHTEAALGALAAIAVPGISQQAAKALVYSPSGRQWLLRWAATKAAAKGASGAVLPNGAGGALNGVAAGLQSDATPAPAQDPSQQ